MDPLLSGPEGGTALSRQGPLGRHECGGKTSRGMRDRLLYWLVPDLALAGFAFTLLFCLLLFDAPSKLFRDSDAGWHIRTGERILAGGGLPRSDAYSFTRSGREWFAWEWASDVLMGMAHRRWGLRGVTVLYVFLIASCTWLWFRLHWAAGGDFLLACLMAAPMLSTANMHWLARPHVIGWVFLLAWMLALEAAPGASRRLWISGLAAAAAGAAWASFHASFFLAPALACLYAASCLLRPLIWKLDRALEWRHARLYLAMATGAAAGSLANPYGWDLHRHLYGYLTNTELLQRVGEFQTFNFHAEGAAQILLMVGLAAAGGILALREQRLAHFFLSALLLAVALRSARTLPVAALLLLPAANGALTAALRKAECLQPRLRRILDAFLAYSGNLRRLDQGLRGYALLPLMLALVPLWLCIPAVAARAGFPPGDFPVEEAARLEPLDPAMRLLAPDKYGGYLIYRFEGGLPVFFDGRSDFYGIGFMRDYIRLVQVRPDWRGLLARYPFTHALLPNDYSLVAALEAEGWRRIARGPVATLLAAPAPSPAEAQLQRE